MNRRYIIEALEAILEDVTGCVLKLPVSSELEAFFEPEEFTVFRDMVADEFDLPDYTIIDTAQTFRELVVLLEDELFQ
jgi:hypothetical protein